MNRMPRIFSAETFLLETDRYLSLMQGDLHMRRVRVVLIWSAATVFYIWGNLRVESVVSAAFVNAELTNITHEKFLVFLLVMTLYYSARFAFSVLQIHAEVPVHILWKEVQRYRGYLKVGFLNPYSDEFKDPIEQMENTAYALLCGWAHNPEGVPKKEKVKPGEESEFSLPNFLRLDPEKLAKIENGNRVQQMLKHPVLWALEVLGAVLLLPALLCVAALVALIWKLAPEYGQPLAAFVAIFLTTFFAHVIDKLIL